MRRHSILILYFYALVAAAIVAIVLESITLRGATIPYDMNGFHRHRQPPFSTTRTTGSRMLNATTMRRIPFFVYPVDLFPESYGNCAHTIASPKHSHDVFAFDAMLKNHPWRVYDQKEAEIAILPVLLDQLSRGRCQTSVTTQVVLQEVQNALNAFDLFPRLRHVILANDFKSARHSSTKRLVRALQPSGIWIAMEGRSDCQTSVGYLSNYALWNATQTNRTGTDPTSLESYRQNHVQTISKPNPTRPASERIYSIHMVGGFDSRWAYRDRLLLFQSGGGSTLPANPYIIAKENKQHLNSLWWWQRRRPIRFCNTTIAQNIDDNHSPHPTTNNNYCEIPGGDYDRCIVDAKLSCPDRGVTQRAAEWSNFTLLLRGDTLGGDRLINAMAAGTALIFVVEDDRDLEWMPFPQVVPWNDLILKIYRRDFVQDPARCLRRTVEGTSPRRLQELQDLSRAYVAALDWTATGSRTLENMIYEAATISCKKHEDYYYTGRK
jgi:hypothetical protein